MSTGQREKVIILVAPVGAQISPEVFPYLPITPEEIAEDTFRCYQAGASVVHIHARDRKTKLITPDIGVFGKIVVTGLEADREGLQVAEGLGAVAINIEKEDLRERVRDMTQGAGVDMAIETPGGGKAIGEDLSVLKKRAKLVLVGLTEDPIHLSRSAFFLRETEMIGIRAHNPKTWEICLKVLSTGKMNLRPLITHRLPLEEGEKGFELLRQGKGLKILLNPGHQN